MKHVILALFLCTTAACAVKAPAQETKPRFAIMDDYVRQILIDDWDLHAKDTIILERGYCLQYQLDFWGQEIAYRVTQIARAKVVESGPGYIAFECPKGPNRAELHVHPATSCLGRNGPCFPGGVYAYQCIESDTDSRNLSYKGQAFGMIQCSREAVIAFWPKFRAESAPLPNMRSGCIVKDSHTSLSYRRDQI